MHGQAIYVDPAIETVMVHTAATRNANIFTAESMGYEAATLGKSLTGPAAAMAPSLGQKDKNKGKAGGLLEGGIPPFRKNTLPPAAQYAVEPARHIRFLHCRY
jgi:hypothetical protein